MTAASEHSRLTTRAFWDRNPCGLSATWEQARNLRYAVTDPYLLRYLTQDRFRGHTVLEIGCGQGFDACEIVRYCDRYVGVDLSGESLRIAQREVRRQCPLSARSEFLVADAERLPFHNGQFSLVYSIGVLHHTGDFPAAVREIHRIVQKEGELILMLYRSFTPLWFTLRAVRGLLRIPFLGGWIRERAMRSLRSTKTHDPDSLTGTVFLELIGAPIIDTYTLGDLRKHFDGRFTIEHATCFRVGFDQLIRCMPKVAQRWWPREAIDGWERRFRQWLGFYLMITARRQ